MIGMESLRGIMRVYNMMAALDCRRDCRTEVGPLWVGDGQELRSPMINEMVVGLDLYFSIFV